MTSKEVMKQTGITERQLNHWIRRGWIAPSGSPSNPGSGQQRCWSEEDLKRVCEVRDAFAKALKILADAGIVTAEGALAGIPPTKARAA